jgi:hypothetical protein
MVVENFTDLDVFLFLYNLLEKCLWKSRHYVYSKGYELCGEVVNE